MPLALRLRHTPPGIPIAVGNGACHPRLISPVVMLELWKCAHFASMVHVSLTVGALELGVFVSTFLFGIATIQAHIYFKRFSKDGLLIKCLVGTVWLLELAHNACVCHGLFVMTLRQYEIPNAGNDRKLDPTFAVAILLSGCIAALTQAYFAYRLRVLSNRLWIPILFWFFAVVRFAGWIWAGVVGIIECIGFNTGTRGEPQWEWPIVPLLAGGAFVDFIIAALICYYFYRSQHVVVHSTARLLDKLIAWTIQNGLITSLAGIATCLSLVLAKETFIWIAVFMLLTRLFCNSFLASLNARLDLRRLATEDHDNTPLSVVQFSSPVSPSQESRV